MIVHISEEMSMAIYRDYALVDWFKIFPWPIATVYDPFQAWARREFQAVLNG